MIAVSHLVFFFNGIGNLGWRYGIKANTVFVFSSQTKVGFFHSENGATGLCWVFLSPDQVFAPSGGNDMKKEVVRFFIRFIYYWP